MYISHEAQFVVNDWKLNQNFEEKKSENRLFKNFDVIITTSVTYTHTRNHLDLLLILNCSNWASWIIL